MSPPMHTFQPASHSGTDLSLLIAWLTKRAGSVYTKVVCSDVQQDSTSHHKTTVASPLNAKLLLERVDIMQIIGL